MSVPGLESSRIAILNKLEEIKEGLRVAPKAPIGFTIIVVSAEGNFFTQCFDPELRLNPLELIGAVEMEKTRLVDIMKSKTYQETIARRVDQDSDQPPS